MKGLKNTNHFIDFANNLSGRYEDYYRNWPKNLFTDAPLLPAIKKIVSARSILNIDTLLECFDKNLCPIPERMTEFIGVVRHSVRNILESIVTNEGKLEVSDDLEFFIDWQERYVKKYQVDNGRLVEKTEMLDGDHWKILLSPGWLSPVCWTLIEFLCSGTLHRLKKCPICENFFIAEHKSRKFCSKDCGKINKNGWQQNYMKKKRDKNGEDFDPKYI